MTPPLKPSNLDCKGGGFDYQLFTDCNKTLRGSMKKILGVALHWKFHSSYYWNVFFLVIWNLVQIQNSWEEQCFKSFWPNDGDWCYRCLIITEPLPNTVWMWYLKSKKRYVEGISMKIWMILCIRLHQIVSLLVYICPSIIELTHWGRATHLCVGNITSISSDNGLSPDRRQAISEPILEYHQLDPYEQTSMKS